MLDRHAARWLVHLATLASIGLTGAVSCGGDGDSSVDSGGGSGAGGDGTSGDAGAGAAPPASNAERFLNDYAAAVCAMYQPCCEAEQLGFDASGCTDWFASVTEAYFSGEFDPERGDACLRALEEARDADPDRCHNVGAFDEATFREECRAAFGPASRTGSDLGGSCLLASDCASSDEGPVICSSGTCLLQLRGEDGDGPCATPERPPTVVVRCEPEDGLYCHRGDNVCRPRVGDGELCPYAGACDDTSMCVGGRCERLPAIGEECLNGIPGAGGFCAPRSVCNAGTLVCEPGLEDGSACQEAEAGECASGVCVDGTCAASDFEQSLNCTG